jgi:hypothetical protein
MGTRRSPRWSPPVELLLFGVAACGRAGIGDSGPVVVAVVEVTDAAPTTSGANVPASEGQGMGGGGACSFEVETDDIEPSSPTCTIYEEVKGGGRLTLPCGGADGPASGSFGEHEYRGEVKGKRVTLQHSYDFQEKDGCRWRVMGKITGVAGAPKVAWSYREEILEDDTSNCWATCTARTSMKLTPVR